MPATTVPAEVIYTTASLIESFKIVPLAPQFLSDKLFPRVSETTTRPSRGRLLQWLARSSPLIARASRRARPCRRERTQTSLFSPPFIKPIRNLTADELYYKTAVQAANATGDRDAELLLLDYQELDAMIGRTRGVDGCRMPVHRQGCLPGWRHRRGRGRA